MSREVKRPREDQKNFVSPHDENVDAFLAQEFKLRLSCEVKHLMFRHVDDLVMVIQKICQKNPEAEKQLSVELARFSLRDKVKPELAGQLTGEQAIYARRLSEAVKDLRSRYPGDLAEVILSLIKNSFASDDFVQKELQRINIVQSGARKKLRE